MLFFDTYLVTLACLLLADAAPFGLGLAFFLRQFLTGTITGGKNN